MPAASVSSWTTYSCQTMTPYSRFKRMFLKRVIVVPGHAVPVAHHEPARRAPLDADAGPDECHLKCEVDEVAGAQMLPRLELGRRLSRKIPFDRPSLAMSYILGSSGSSLLRSGRYPPAPRSGQVPPRPGPAPAGRGSPSSRSWHRRRRPCSSPMMKRPSIAPARTDTISGHRGSR